MELLSVKRQHSPLFCGRVSQWAKVTPQLLLPLKAKSRRPSLFYVCASRQAKVMLHLLRRGRQGGRFSPFFAAFCLPGTGRVWGGGGWRWSKILLQGPKLIKKGGVFCFSEGELTK